MSSIDERQSIVERLEEHHEKLGNHFASLKSEIKILNKELEGLRTMCTFVVNEMEFNEKLIASILNGLK